MPECSGCGSHVSQRYARVLGDNDSNAHACMECRRRQDRFNGAVGGLL
ncbi:DUF7563 family protein [Halocatena halophila]